MAAKYQLITELYRRTGVSVAKSPQAWQSFLSSACRNYKCRFDEQLLIYAQRPDAVAVAELGTWNKLFKRWVNKDSKGIAVFDPKGRRNTLKYYFDISDTHEGYYGSRPVPIWQMDERYEQAVKERLSDRFGEIEETDLAETLFKTAENAVEDNLPDYLSQLKSVTQDSFLEGLDEYNIEVLYKRLAVNSVAFMLMSRCGLDVKEYFDREDFADIVNFNTPHTINAIGIATSDISEMALREISAAIRNVQMEARGENRTFAPKSQSRYDVGRKQPERSENNERNHIHKAGGLSYSRPNITDRARASAWQIRYDAQGVSGAAQESDLSEPADRGDAKSASLRGGTDGTQTVGASDEAALNGAGRDGGTEGKSPDAVGRIDEQHPQPSGGSHLDGTDLQLSIANEEEVSANLPTVEQQIEKITQAEDEKSSAFVVSQEDIDSVLQMGSSYDKSKYRIYRQLQKNSDSKTNIEFLKKEYGTGGGTHIFPDGTQGGRWADSKGIAIEKQGSYTDPDLRLSWSKVEKRLRELIKNDRYLNPKEKDHYADYLEQVSAPQYEIDTQRKLVRQRFIQSKQALSPADKRDSLALRLSDFIRDLDGYEKELLSQVNRTDLANINDRQMEEQLSDPATVQQLLDFLALVQGKTSDTYSRSNAWYFSKELTELHPMHYLCHEGDVVYLGADKYEVQSVTEDRVTLQNVQFPILMQAYNHTKLSELLNKNPANDHLKVVVTDRQKSETLTEKKPDSLEFSIGFSEHPCFYADGLGDDIEISFALGNKLLGILDEKQHRERQDESKKVGWYKKTDFQINAVINGENFRYDGRFDIGDGEGDLIAHLKNHYDYCLSPNCPFIPEWKKQGEDAYRKKMESLRWGREVFIPYLEQHTELSQEDEMQLDAFMASESYWYKEKEELLEQAKKFIDDYAYKKYGQSDRVDYSDLSKIEIATATTEDGQRKFMVMLDLENYRMKFYENGKCTDYTEYLSLADMIAADISHSDFESFVLERAEKYNQLYREEKTEAVPKDTDRLNARELESSREQLSEPIEDDFIGREIVLDNRRYVIERISEISGDVSMRDVTFQNQAGIPINRVEKIGYIRSLLEREVLPPEKENVDVPVPSDDRRNFRITDDALGVGGAKEKFRNNIAAIQTLHELEIENRLATPEEQEILSKYVGWGGLSQAFDENNAAWADEFIELYENLSPEEYRAAMESTLTAFYTPPVVIKAMYGVLDRLGYEKGNMLEPSCGTGNFFGLIPEKMAGSKLYGVELDDLTGRIAKQLYQKATIAVQGFEDTKLPDDHFDVVLGNVPFGDFRVNDSRYEQQKFLIHDYFFAKALDKVKAGGVVMLLTSKGTMDKASPEVRKYIAQRAELLGAIRLPDNTFKANAGTEVTSDILILKKRDRVMEIEPEWVHLDTDENGITMNRYFVEHPEMVLGTMQMESTRCPICGNKTRDRVMEDSRHACGLVLDNGMELLLHIGIDTVEMQGDGFEYLIKEGQEVKAGTPLIRFNRQKIKEAGYSDVTVCVITDGADEKTVHFHTGIYAQENETVIIEIE